MLFQTYDYTTWIAFAVAWILQLVFSVLTQRYEARVKKAKPPNVFEVGFLYLGEIGEGFQEIKKNLIRRFFIFQYFNFFKSKISLILLIEIFQIRNLNFFLLYEILSDSKFRHNFIIQHFIHTQNFNTFHDQKFLACKIGYFSCQNF